MQKGVPKMRYAKMRYAKKSMQKGMQKKVRVQKGMQKNQVVWGKKLISKGRARYSRDFV
jgi:hypothetical protein